MTIDTTITKLPDGFLLAFDEVYDTTVDDLWSAVTEPDRLRRWMVEYRGDLRLGGTWEALSKDGTVWCRGTVTSCDAPRFFTTTWQHAEEPENLVTVELGAVEGGARLHLRHEGVQATYYGAGWQTYLEFLAEEIAHPDTPPRGGAEEWDARFAELADAYEAKFTAAAHRVAS